MIGSHTNHKAFNHLKFFALISLGCLFFAATSTHAQERSGLGNEENLKGQDELSPHLDNPINSLTPSTSAPVSKEKENYRDTIAVKPQTHSRNKSETSAQKKSEDETLSFNLLYFIIQKFKVSDMMN